MTPRGGRRSTRGSVPPGLLLLIVAVGVIAAVLGVLRPQIRVDPTRPLPSIVVPDASGSSPSQPSGSDGSRAPAAGAPGTALAQLARLPVKGFAPGTGYDRTARFGSAWLDVDRNGCDTRDDILHRDLTGAASSTCRIRSGTLADPYTGRRIRFVRGRSTSSAVQIDHVVALRDAWRTGAAKLAQADRERLANDPLNLFAVDGPTNEAKGDGDAATWLPPVKSFRCTYVAHQVAVKTAYRLWVTPAEQAAMRRVLGTCPGQAAPASPLRAG